MPIDNWLARVGAQGRVRATGAVNEEVVRAILSRLAVPDYTLDVDTTVIESGKKGGGLDVVDGGEDESAAQREGLAAAQDFGPDLLRRPSPPNFKFFTPARSRDFLIL
jgi:hypothetical protein